MEQNNHKFHADARGPSVRLSGNNGTACRLQPRGSYNGGMVFSNQFRFNIQSGSDFGIRTDRLRSELNRYDILKPI